MRPVFWATLFALTLTNTAAEDATELVVRGSRLDTPALEAGTAVTVLTDEDIARRADRFVFETLRAVPGVTVTQTGANGGVATVRLRGTSAGQTLTLIDGIPVGDPTAPGSGFDYGLLDTIDIARIEVLRGPQSVLWGSDAIGGVVSITTKTPGRDTAIGLLAEGGAQETVRLGLAASGGTAALKGRLALHGTRTRGISKADEAQGNDERDGYGQFAIRGTIERALGKWALRIGGDHSVTDTEIDGFSPVDFSFGDTNEHTETTQSTAFVTLANAPTAPLRHELQAGFYDIDRQTFDGEVRGFGAAGQRGFIRHQTTLTLSENYTFAAGAEYEETRQDDDSVGTGSVFGLFRWQGESGLSATTGLRHDEHETFGGQTTGKVAAQWRPRDDFALRGSWGTGFKAPTLFQLTAAFGTAPPNGELEPETSEGYDLAVDLGRADGVAALGVTWFDLSVDNQIDYDFLLGNYQNIAALDSQGVELAGHLALTPRLRLQGQYSWTEAELAGGGRPLRVPEHAAAADLHWQVSAATAVTLLAHYQGERDDVATRLDPVWRVGGVVRHTLSDELELYGRIENLTDADEPDVAGYSVVGRSLYAGVRVRL
jgi:vitamin B12 transporter